MRRQRDSEHIDDIPALPKLCYRCQQTLPVLLVLASSALGNPIKTTEIKQNPTPKQRYEIRRNIHDAPGPFDTIRAFANYRVTNAGCIPRTPVTGIRIEPQEALPMTLTKLRDGVHRGTVYADQFMDGDYYGLGLCNWELGKVDIIATALAYIAGYNIRLLPIIQSMAQLDAPHSKEVYRSLIINHALQIVYAPRKQQDANDYSDMLGYTTVRKENVTRGKNDTSRSHTEERRALMLPQKLKSMGPDREVFFYEGILHPVMCDKIRYYNDRHFTARLLSKVEVPTLAI